MPQDLNEVVYYRVITRKYRTPPSTSSSPYGYENHQFVDHYEFTGYHWLLDSRTGVAFSGTNEGGSYRSSYAGQQPEVWAPIPSPGGDALNYELERVIDTYQGTYGGSPVTVRVHHAGQGNLTYEYDNPLHIQLDARDIQPVGATVNGVTPPGQVTVHVVTASGSAPPIDGNIHIWGAVYPKGGPPPADASADWQEFTVNGDYYNAPFQREASCSFPVAAAGDYTCGVRILYGTRPSAYPNLTKEFSVAQTTAAAGTLAFVRPQPDPTATALGRATGVIPVQLTMTGPATLVAVVKLTQDNRTWGGPITVEHRHPASNNPPYETQFTNLPAGLYTLTTYLNNNVSVTDTLAVEVPPPPLEIGDQLTFLPWVQPALTKAATKATVQLGATLQTDQGTRTSKTEPITGPTARIYGPGDVLGLNQRAILGTTPAPGAVGFSPFQLAAIEFKDEDLPWRYSTRQRAAYSVTPTSLPQPEAPLPWLFLLVLKEGEYDALPLVGQPLPSIRVHAAVPYPAAEARQQELWAHVQINTTLGPLPTDPQAAPTAPSPVDITQFLTQTLPTHPDLAYSRVMSPRRLAADTAYTAFLLPAVEAGRLAGLGQNFTEAHLGESAIPTAPSTGSTPALDFPVYFQWQFTTGTEEDFESLVGQLGSAQASTTAAQAPSLAVALPTAALALPMPSLLLDPAATATADPAGTAAQELAAAQYLYGQLAPGFTLRRPATGRPVVTPPLYGRAYMVTPTLLEPRLAVANSWKHQVNLDPRYRALAALGAQVVQDNQEEYVRRAWEQVQDILLANEKLRGLQYGLRTATGLRDQHLPLDTITTTTTSLPGGGRFAKFAASTASVTEDITGQRLAADSLAALAPATASPSLADYGLHLTGLSLSRTRISATTAALLAAADPTTATPVRLTVREAIRRSSTPLAAFSPAFRRVMKPFGKYQVGAAGRPLRPTQPEPALDAFADLRQPGTSLRQRDALLSRLAEGHLTAAASRAEQVRAYQFNDELVDHFLRDAPPLSPSPASLGGNSLAVSNFKLAFSAFRDLGQTDQGEVIVVGFKKPQYVRPLLPLAELKNDVAVGTEPGPVILTKVQQVAPAVPVAPVPAGDFEGQDYNADDFYVGDYDEPAPVLIIRGDWAASDFSGADFLVDVYALADAPALVPFSVVSREVPAEESAPVMVVARSFAQAATLTTATTTTTTTGAAPATALPVIKQTQVFPVFKDAMSEPLRQRHPELFVLGLGDFPAGGVAVLGVNQAFIEAYMVGLNHALGSELRWRGFPVDLRGTFFQQFWDVSEHLNQLPEPTTPLTAAEKAAQEASLLDIKPLDQWVSAPLGNNAPSPNTLGREPLRLAIRSELLRRYPTLVIGLQPGTTDGPDEDPAKLLVPRQRLAVGQDVAVVVFDVTLDEALNEHYYLMLMERPGQPQFGLDENVPQDTPATDDPLSWDDFSWEYLNTKVGDNIFVDPAGKPRASAEPAAVAHLTDSAVVAYALFQEPVLAALPVRNLLG